MANTNNLEPFAGASDSRKTNGAQKGSISTMIDGLLGANIGFTGPINERHEKV